MRMLLPIIIILTVCSFATKPKIGMPAWDKDDYQGCFENNADGGEMSEISLFVVKLQKEKKLYGSSNIMPVVGEMRAVKKELECHYIRSPKGRNFNKSYLIFATNIPQQEKVEFRDVMKCNVNGKNCGRKSDYSFYMCVGSESSKDGCKVTENGMDLVVMRNRNGKMVVANTNKEGLKFYYDLKKGIVDLYEIESDIDKFYRELKRQDFDNFNVTVPYGATEEDFLRIGDEAVQIAPGLLYVVDGDFFDEIAYEKSPFKNLKDALDHCYDWGQKQLR